ncbi:hypothetical protein [Stenotrophomonas maltophilia]|uniref:hypothetical protein n=1 Tax=Stenotrophomonas maltophilia TaxID=40324 RepID=UPI00240E27BE|nr:hypothetical protein [Stenotrophomonas maltophilia]MDG2510973.1 hypothetical protein [Stenotrophomonas maltophilia]
MKLHASLTCIELSQSLGVSCSSQPTARVKEFEEELKPLREDVSQGRMVSISTMQPKAG